MCHVYCVMCHVYCPPSLSCVTKETTSASKLFWYDSSGVHVEGKNIHFVKFSGRAVQTATLMVFCIETQTLKVILTVFYLVLTSEILPAGAGKGEEDFSAEKRTCVNLALIAFCIGSLQIYQKKHTFRE